MNNVKALKNLLLTAPSQDGSVKYSFEPLK